MTEKKALKIILGISIVGILFSGTLSYKEVVLEGCTVGCGQSGLILGLPACVYGLVMYSVVVVITLLGSRGKK